MKKLSFADHLTNYLTVFLPGQQGLSENTILSYRDAFVLFLRFLRDSKGFKIEKISFDHLDKATVENYLSWLESEKGAAVSTRNQRLAALKSFFRYLQTEAPEYLSLCQGIIAIGPKKQAKPLINYLSAEGIKTLLAQPDTSTASGRRDLALLETLYDSAARAQELCDVKVCDLRLQPTAVVKLTGKGGKSRQVPLTSPVASLLRQYIRENKLDESAHSNAPLFSSRAGSALTRSGVGYILKKYAGQARKAAPNQIPSVFSPHCLRHSKAMHLLQSGSNLVYIRDILGHEDIETTQIYARADPEIKRKSIEAAYTEGLPNGMPSWTEQPDLMKRLMSLGKA